MSGEPGTLEQRLLQVYQEQLRHYDRALAILDDPGRVDSDLPTAWVEALDAVLRNVTALDDATMNDKAAWRRAGLHPGPALRVLLDQVAQRIATLTVAVQQRVADLQASKQQLLPAIDTFIQKRRMLQAYGNYGDRQSHVAKST